MNEEQIKNLKLIIVECEKDIKEYSFNLNSFINDEDLKEIKSLSELEDFFNDLNHNNNICINEAEVIYYSEAMEILNNLDNTLMESLNKAYDLGYEIKNLNSCILATLIKEEEVIKAYEELIETILSNLNEDLESV